MIIWESHSETLKHRFSRKRTFPVRDKQTVNANHWAPRELTTKETKIRTWIRFCHCGGVLSTLMLLSIRNVLLFTNHRHQIHWNIKASNKISQYVCKMTLKAWHISFFIGVCVPIRTFLSDLLGKAHLKIYHIIILNGHGANIKTIYCLIISGLPVSLMLFNLTAHKEMSKR